MSGARAQQKPFAPTSLGAAFVAACAVRHDRDFLVDDDLRLDGASAERTSRRLAAVLHARGLKAGARVAFMCRPSVAHTLTWFAAARLGGVATNLHLLELPERLAETIAWLGADLVVHDEEFKDVARGIATNARHLNIVGLSRIVEEASAAEASGLHLDSTVLNDPVAIVLSSGSTGRPKGVVHTHSSVLASIAAGVALYCGIGNGDSVLVCIGTSFGGWCNVVLPFVGASAKLVFQRRFDPRAFVAGLAAEKITIAPLVPTMWRLVLAQEPELYDLSAVRLAFMSGEAVSRRDVESVRARITPNVRTAYLSTEGACASGAVADERDYPGDGPTAAHLLDSVEIKIVAADGPAGARLPAEQTGEILLCSASLAQGYWKDPQLSSDRFVDGWWRSGDTGFMTADGRLVVAGRTDHVINSGGVKVQAEDIEAALMAHPRIRQVAVIGLPDAKWGQRAEAFVVSDIDAETIDAWCRTAGFVPPLRFLKAIHVVDALPTGPTGKLYRPALRSQRD
jgi:acyl-CoA synthetase (AMP-forming)/AMP-acid ligase II